MKTNTAQLKNWFWVHPIALALLIFSSCDKVENPYAHLKTSNCDGEVNVLANYTTYNDTTETKRKILVEEFTGHGCGNCPNGARRLEDLITQYGDQLLVTSIHAGSFAVVDYLNDGHSFLTDHTTPAGEEYFTFFRIGGNPRAMINRVNYSETATNHALGISAWTPTINELFSNSTYMDPSLKFYIESIYNTESRKLSLTIKSEALKAIEGSYNIAIYVLESHIIDWQLDYNNPVDPNVEKIEDYEHNHLLHDVLPSEFGETLINNSMPNGAEITKEYCYELNENWNPENVSIIVYAYNTTTYEILQAEDLYIYKP